MAHASLEELHEAIEELQADGRSKVESRASALDMRRAIDQTAATISSLRARAVAEPEAVAEELVNLFFRGRQAVGAWGVGSLTPTRSVNLTTFRLLRLQCSLEGKHRRTAAGSMLLPAATTEHCQ